MYEPEPHYVTARQALKFIAFLQPDAAPTDRLRHFLENGATHARGRLTRPSLPIPKDYWRSESSRGLADWNEGVFAAGPGLASRYDNPLYTLENVQIDFDALKNVYRAHDPVTVAQAEKLISQPTQAEPVRNTDRWHVVMAIIADLGRQGYFTPGHSKLISNHVELMKLIQDSPRWKGQRNKLFSEKTLRPAASFLFSHAISDPE